jgi:molybdopterin converting factor small subunit
MSTVRIPPTLRAATSGAKLIEVDGTTVRDVVGGLVNRYPSLSQQVLDADGGLNRFVNVFLNDTDVRHLEGLDTPVRDTDSLVLLPAMAGG